MNVYYKVIFNRRKQLNSDGTAPVHIEVVINRVAKFYHTGVVIEKDSWDEAGKKVIKGKDKVLYNAKIDRLLSNIKDLHTRCLQRNIDLTFSIIDQEIKNKTENSKNTFIDFILAESKKDNRLAPGTQKQHEALANLLTKFKQIQSFNDLTYEKIKLFDEWMRSEHKVQTTIHGYHKRMVNYIHRAINYGYVRYENNPYRQFKNKSGRYADRQILSMDEIRAIETKQMPNDRLQWVKDLFLFQCYTGLAYVDMVSLTPENIHIDDQGNKFLIVYRAKSDTKSIIYLFKQAIEIIEKYRTTTRLILNKSYQPYNAYLTEIATLCNINKHLSTHTARHSFASTIMAGNNVPIETTSKALGHKSVRTTQVYYKVAEKNVIDNMKKIDI